MKSKPQQGMEGDDEDRLVNLQQINRIRPKLIGNKRKW